MGFPFLIAKDRHGQCSDRWFKNFEMQNDPDRRYAICNWGRHQVKSNKRCSGWQYKGDARRTLVYLHQDLSSATGDLCLHGLWIYCCFTFPSGELDLYERRILEKLSLSGWILCGKKQYRFNELTLCIKNYHVHPEDETAGRSFPEKYRSLEIQITSDGYTAYKRALETPWKVQKTGFRKQDKPGEHIERINNLEKILPVLPAQIELGSGPSISAGIPALHHLHSLYAVSDPVTKKFRLDLQNHDLLDRIIESPFAFFREASHIYRTIFRPGLTPFYDILKLLHDKGVFVGPVITNNFDGFVTRCGLREEYVRRFSEKRYPDIKFDPRANSLLVIGSHADRRKIQNKARQEGLKVIYIDPEGFYEKDGTFWSYPLESPHDEDFVWNITAEKFSEHFANYFNV